ncbi:hypothetical protein JCM10213v2_003767 [Rhodosporidiobolus nylandii]
MSFFDAYRPRKPSRKELEEDNERERQHKRRRIETKRRDFEQANDRSSRLNFSSLNGVAYKDYTLGPSGNVKPRTRLDKEAYAAYRARRAQEEDEEELEEVPRLAEVCLAVLSENYGEPGLFDALEPGPLSAYVEPLLAAVEEAADQDAVPFQTFLDFAARLKGDLASRRRTYRGLCVSDVDELSVLAEVNEEAVQLYAREQALSSPSSLSTFVPPFFLAFLDLSGEVGFNDTDISRLKNPLSHFLAVLRLDGTSCTDAALRWIASAADDPPRYSHLQVLSLRNLPKVTDEGVVRLAKLNLRSLDLRGTSCTAHLRDKLNAAIPDHLSATFFRLARPRNDLPAEALELQLFDPANFSPSRVLSILHHLARLQHSSAEQRAALRKAPSVKPVAVHLTSMSRKAASSSQAVKAEKTVDDLYREQLELKAGATHATHHRAFGAVTSTMALSRKAVEVDGHAEVDRGAAFRGRNDAIAGGQFLGEAGKAGGGRASLYDVATRKVHNPQGGPAVDRYGLRQGRDPLSDSEEEAEQVAEEAAKLEQAQREWDEVTGAARHFYAGQRPKARPPRTLVAPQPSKLMLVRHLPYCPPYEPPEPVVPPAREEVEAEVMRIEAGATLTKKKRRSEGGGAGAAFFSPSPTPFSPRPASPADRPLHPRPSIASSLPPSSFSPSPAATPVKPASSNTFSKKRPALATPRHAQKNIVKTAAALPKRSGLAAFRRR